MKFCTNCGNQLGSEKFCTKCGAPVPQGTPSSPSGNVYNTNPYANGVYGGTNVVYAKKTSTKTVLAILAFVALAVIIVAAVVVFHLFGDKISLLFHERGYETVVDRYMEAIIEGDGEAIISLLPDAVVDWLDEGVGGRDQMIEIFETMYIVDRSYDLSDVSWEIVDVDKIPDYKDYEDYKTNEIQEVQEVYDMLMDVTIKDAVIIEVEATVDGVGTETVYVPVVKIGRSWYWDFLGQDYRYYNSYFTQPLK